MYIKLNKSILYIMMLVLVSFSVLSVDIPYSFNHNTGNKNLTHSFNSNTTNENMTLESSNNNSCLIGACQVFTGGQRDVVSTSEITSNFTVAFWYHRDGSGVSNMMLYAPNPVLTDYLFINSQQQSNRIRINYNAIGDNIIDINPIPTVSAWHSIVVTVNGSHVCAYSDSVLEDTCNDIGTTFNPSNFTFGAEVLNQNYYNGQLEMIVITDVAWNQSTVNVYHNSGEGLDFYEPESSNIDLLFRNTTDTTYNTIFDEDEEFWTYINWTDLNSFIPITGDSCNITFIDGLIENNTGIDNQSICNTGCDLINVHNETVSFHGTENTVEDIILLDICHTNSIVSDFYLNVSCNNFTNSLHIDSTEFPLCDVGFTEFNLTFNNCQNETEINLNVSNDAVNINQAHNIINLEVDRRYSEHLNSGSEVFYNSSIQLWQTIHVHHYLKHGTSTIIANCTNSTQSGYNNDKSENITIVNRAPLIQFSEIKIGNTEYFFINDTTYNFLFGSVQFFITVSDDDLITSTYEISNSSSDILLNGTDFTSINISSDKFRMFTNNPIKIIINATDTQNLTTTKYYQFNFTDFINPQCTGLSNTQVLNATNYTWSVNCQDESFFSFNISCSTGFNFSQTGLNQQTYSFSDSFIVTNTSICQYEYCDGHTNTILEKKWFVRPLSNTIEFEVNGFTHRLESLDDNVSFNYSIEYDRISFTVENDNPKDKKLDYSFIYHTSDKSYPLASDKYKAWIVDAKSKTWFDLNNDGDYKVTVTQWNSTSYYINVKSSSDKIKFESIGELNCISGAQIITVADITGSEGFGIFSEQTCPLERSLSWIIGFIAIIIFLLWLLVWNSQNMDFPFIYMLVGILFIGVSVSIWACSVIMAVPFTLFGLLLMIKELDLF